MVKMEIHNAIKVREYIIKLPIQLDRELSKTNYEFMKAVRKSAKLRAPRDTSETAKSIELKKTKTAGKTKQWKIIVNSRAAIFQELGFKPHWAYIENSKKLTPGLYFVKKSKPFLAPAIEHNLNTFAQKLNTASTKAMRTK